MGNLYALMHPKNGANIRAIQVTRDLQGSLQERFELMEQQFSEGIDEYIQFDGGYNPDENQMLQISPTEEMRSLSVQLQEGPHGRDRYDPDENMPDDIRALLWVYETGEQVRIIFQNFTRAQAVSSRGVLLRLTDNRTFNRIREPTILLTDRIDAILWNEHLQFRSFHVAKQIFDLSDVYRAATDEEVQNFISLPGISEVEDGFLNRLNVTQRRLIFSINRAGILFRMSMQEIGRRATDCDLNLNIVDGQLGLPEGSELTETLRFLENGVYRSPMDDQVYMSNSHRRMR